MLTSGWAGGRDTHEPWPYAGSAGVSSGRTTTNTRLENKEAPGITVRPSAVSPRCTSHLAALLGPQLPTIILFCRGSILAFFEAE